MWGGESDPLQTAERQMGNRSNVFREINIRNEGHFETCVIRSYIIADAVFFFRAGVNQMEWRYDKSSEIGLFCKKL